MDKNFTIRVYGRVQGVFFRQTAKKEAKRLSLRGFVRNEPDGTVYMEVEGKEDKIQDFVRWCRNGSDLAKIEKVDIGEGSFRDFKDFSVL